MGTNKYSNHSTTGSATLIATGYDNHSTVALGYQHAKEQFVDNFFLRYICVQHAAYSW